MKKDFTSFRTKMNEDAAIQARLRKGEDPVGVLDQIGTSGRVGQLRCAEARPTERGFGPVLRE